MTRLALMLTAAEAMLGVLFVGGLMFLAAYPLALLWQAARPVDPRDAVKRAHDWEGERP